MSGLVSAWDAVNAACRTGGCPGLASEITINDRIIRNPRRALTIEEATAMIQAWRDGYAELGFPVCPKTSLSLHSLCDAGCAVGCTPNYDSERIVASMLSLLAADPRE